MKQGRSGREGATPSSRRRFHSLQRHGVVEFGKKMALPGRSCLSIGVVTAVWTPITPNAGSLFHG